MDKQTHNLLINVDNLTRGFGDTPELLFDRFNFALYKWDFTVLMWKSGKGKTTFSKFLTWKLKAPRKSIYYKMSDIASFSDKEIQAYRRELWLVFQDSKLLKSLSVRDNIIYPLKIYWMGEATIEAKYARVRRELDLVNIEDREIARLSWWERQLVNMARAIIHDPEFIIADEPTGNLDWENTQKIADILIKFNKEWKTILLFTHDIHLLNYIKSSIDVNLFKL